MVEVEADMALCITVIIHKVNIVVTLVILTIIITEVETLIFVGAIPIWTLNRRATTGNKAVAGHRTAPRISREANEFAVVG